MCKAPGWKGFPYNNNNILKNHSSRIGRLQSIFFTFVFLAYFAVLLNSFILRLHSVHDLVFRFILFSFYNFYYHGFYLKKKQQTLLFTFISLGLHTFTIPFLKPRHFLNFQSRFLHLLPHFRFLVASKNIFLPIPETRPLLNMPLIASLFFPI